MTAAKNLKLSNFQPFNNDLELYTVAEFHDLMVTLGDDICTIKMTQIKPEEKYKNSIQLVSREGKSNIILGC